MSLAVKLLTILAVFAAGCAAGIKWHAGQDARAEVQRLDALAETVRLARASETRRSTQVIEAQNAQAKRSQTLAAAAAAARAESGGLRDDIAAIRAGLPSSAASAGADRCSASTELLDVLERGIEGLAATGAGIAAAADGHASDTLTLQQAWPR